MGRTHVQARARRDRAHQPVLCLADIVGVELGRNPLDRHEIELLFGARGVAPDPRLREGLEQKREIEQRRRRWSGEGGGNVVAHVGHGPHRHGQKRKQDAVLEVGYVSHEARAEGAHLQFPELLRRRHHPLEERRVALLAVVDGRLELHQVFARVAFRVRDVLTDRIDDRRLVLAPLVEVRSGLVQLRQHLLAPPDPVGGGGRTWNRRSSMNCR